MSSKKEVPKLGPKNKTGLSGGKAEVNPNSSVAKPSPSTPATRPSATPNQSSTNLPKRKPPKIASRQSSEASLGSDATRRPSLPSKRPSNLSGRQGSINPSRRPSKLPPRQNSETSSNSPQVRTSSLASKAPSSLGNASTNASSDRKPPKLGPRKNNAAGSQQAKASRPIPASNSGPSKPSNQDGAAHKVDEEQQDLRSILSDSQCEDIVCLTFSITNRMRKKIEDNFSATATLKKIGKEDGPKDVLASLDYDPGTVDVAAYDKEKKLRDERQKQLSTPKVKELKTASLKWFDEWRDGFLKRVDETINPGKIPSSKRAQSEASPKNLLPESRPIQTLGADAKGQNQVPPKLEELFPRVPTPLTKMPLSQRTLVVHSFLLLLLSLEHYNAASRVFLLYLASSLKLGLKALRDDEEKTAKGLLQAAKEISASKESLAKGKESEESRRWKMRLATAAGAAIVGLSGGYAAPMIAATVGGLMSEMGLGASAAAGYLGSVAGNTYLVGSLFGAYGGHMTGEMMRNLSADVEDFAFLPMHGERKEHDDSINAVTDSRRLRVVIAISGWLLEKEEVVTPWRVLKPSAECFALRFEIETLMSLGQSINTMTANDAYGFAQTAFTQRAMVTDLTSAIWPMALVKIARVVENPFSLAKARSDKAGKVLAEALMSRTQGERPVTLVGYSLGARVIWSCLSTLAEKRVFGLVESAVMLGAPVPSDIGTWRSMRTAVSGRLINVYSKNDYLLAFLYRTSALQYGVAGLMPISGLSGVENIDVSETVSGHLRYRYLVGSILQQVGFEDIDKDEVTKEADAYKKMTEEEEKEKEKHDYVEEVKESAGELYKRYAKSGKQPPTKKISDKEADKQASAMEKEVQQNTQKGLMQWAVEQLYLSRPSVPSAEDVEKVKSDPQAATKGTAKSAQKTTDAATKSIYQRAKDAVYISRSGGSEGQDVAEGKLAQAQDTASSGPQTSYLATAAGYIPTSYIPSLRGTTAAKKTEKAPKAPNATAGAKDVGKATTAAKKKKKPSKPAVDQAQPKPEKEIPSQEGGEFGDAQSTTDKAEGAPKDIPEETATEAPGDQPEEVGKGKSPEGDAEEGKGAGDAAQSAQSNVSAAEGDPDKDAQASKGYSSYIPSFGFGASSSHKNTPAQSSKDAPNVSDSASFQTAEEGNPEEGNDSSLASTPTKAGSSTKKDGGRGRAGASGYGSYFPSFGFGGSAAAKGGEVGGGGGEDEKDVREESGEGKKTETVEQQQKSPLEDPFVD